MEKLQPILKQKFWILLAVTLIMPVVGWWMATANLLQAITTRKTAIDAAFKKVPTGAVPNENWTKELSNLNELQAKAINSAKSLPWKKQQSKLMNWPEGVDLRNGYWGKFSTESHEVIRRAYPEEVRKVWKMVNPLDPNEHDAVGIVLYPFVNMYDVLKLKPWKNVTGVSAETLWEMKEDLWLLERLFQSITSINGGMEVTQNDASIHTIDRLELRGGGTKVTPMAAPMNRGAAAIPAAGIASGRAPAGKVARIQEDDGPGGSGILSGGQTSGAAGANIQKTSADFDPAEELGSDGSSGGAPATGSIGAGSVRERYVTKDEGLPYKTRGFYISVKMDHRKIPELIAELTANEDPILPIEILRVQMSRLQEDEVTKVIENQSPNNNLRPGQASPMGGPMGGMAGRRTRVAESDEEEPRGAARLGLNLGGNRTGRPGLALPGTTNLDGTLRNDVAAAEATLRKVLSDPVMAQVTICGVFLLYKKVEEPVAPNATPASPGSTAAPAATTSEELKNDDQPQASSEASDQPADESAAKETTDPNMESTVESDAPNEPSDGSPTTDENKTADEKPANEEK